MTMEFYEQEEVGTTTHRVWRPDDGDICLVRGCAQGCLPGKAICNYHVARLTRSCVLWLLGTWSRYRVDALNADLFREHDEAQDYAAAQLEGLGLQWGATVPLPEREARVAAWWAQRQQAPVAVTR
jgi:hypothetical protein